MTDPLPGWAHRTADYYPWENPMNEPLSQQVQTVETPEPVMNAEKVRLLIGLLVTAGWLAPIPDPLLAVVVPILVTLAGAGWSWVMSQTARGKVLAIRKGIDLNELLDALRRA